MSTVETAACCSIRSRANDAAPDPLWIPSHRTDQYNCMKEYGLPKSRSEHSGNPGSPCFQADSGICVPNCLIRNSLSVHSAADPASFVMMINTGTGRRCGWRTIWGTDPARIRPPGRHSGDGVLCSAFCREKDTDGFPYDRIALVFDMRRNIRK